MGSLTTYFGGLSYRLFFMFAQWARLLLVCLGFVSTTRRRYFEQCFGQCLPEKLYKLARTERPEITFNSIIRIYPKLKEYLFRNQEKRLNCFTILSRTCCQ